MKNILLYSNDPIMIAGFQTVVQASGEFLLSGCRDLCLLSQCVLDERAHIVVLDASCGITLDLLTVLRATAPSVAVILWADTFCSEFISQAIVAGVSGVLRKSTPIESFWHCLHQVAAGELWVDNELSNKLLRVRRVQLTPRERQVMGMLAQGLTNKELAYRLGLTPGTVKVYLSRLYKKVGANDRFELALAALKNLASDQPTASERLHSANMPFLMPRSFNIEQLPVPVN